MSLLDKRWTLVFICAVVRVSNGQATGSNVPGSPLWPIFSQLLSTQTGRTLQDINTLGLSDPTIKQLWTGYSASMAKLTQTPAPTKTTPTTPPPLPDLYQTSYSFSSSGNQAAANQAAANQAAANQAAASQAAANQAAANQAASAAKAKSPGNTMLYNDIVNLINKLSASPALSPSAPQATSTSAQDVMNAYAQLSASNSGFASSNPMQAVMDQLAASAGTSSTTGGTNYQALLQQYLSSTGGGGASSTNNLSGSSGTSSNSAPSYQSLVDQYNSIMNQGGTGSSASSGTSGTNYEQLLQQYNQIMGGKTLGTPATTGSTGGTASSVVEQYMAQQPKKEPATGVSADQLMQMYAQMMGGKPQDTITNAAATTSSPISTQETFDKQLATFFPQFKSLFPQTSPGNASSASAGTGSSGSDPTTSNTAQMIFDAILFAPPQPATGGTSSATAAETSTQAPQEATTHNTAIGVVQNLENSRAGAEALLSNHVQNVFKTRASREMGCRFLPELLELDVLATAPINCMNRCPFPYVNSQQFGMYCVCCPPGVNEQTVGMMSLVRGTSYMESPLAVVS